MEDIKEYYTFNEYMKKNNLTPNEEDYIEMIYRISLQEEHVKVSDVSKCLNITPASVSKMIKKLDKKKLLIYKKYDYIELSEIGCIVGKKLLHRHNVVNNFLSVIGVKENLHEETEKIEHTIGINTLIKIDEFTKFVKESEDILQRFDRYKNTLKKKK